jgi:hypothetical protein
MNTVFRLKKKQAGKDVFAVNLSTWNKTGTYFTSDELIKLLKRYFDKNNDTFPEDWEIVEYQLHLLKTITTNKFISTKSKFPFVKGI